ncbi:MAG: riboflavin kinase / adenylyltransferase, partial [Pseudomonadota bacterium]|nr:riboflavin kinase / adenylyltransferase [Pseudomonadota bacterium]
MNLFKLNREASDLSHGSVLTIGNFDGVHLGHQALLNELLKKSTLVGLPSIVVLFEPHPKELFLKNLAPKRIYTLREKIVYLQRLGVDYIFCIEFTQSFSDIEPLMFIQSILHERLQVKFLFVGHD